MKATMVRICILFLLLSAAACTAAGPAAENADRIQEEAALRQRVERYYETLSARDWDAYEDFFWPQATLTTVWQPAGEPSPRVVVASIDEFLANTAQGPDSQPIFEESLISQEIRMVRDLANVWAHYEARFGDSTSVMTWRGIDAFTWMKHDGDWRIVALAYTNEPNEPHGEP